MMVWKVLAVVGVLLLLAVALWSNLAAPCSMFRNLPTKDVPARCLGEYTR